MYVESHARSVVKAVSYRALGTLGTMAVVYLYTGRLSATFAVGGADLVIKLGLFFIHERLWSKVHWGKRQVEPFVVWFTGLSGAGKTTLSQRLAERLRGKGLKVEHLDGDSLREIFPATGFDRQSREEHVRKVGLLARYLEKNGVFVVASLISPYEGSRGFVRGICKNFIEVHVDTPLEECERRDVKGLYRRARAGELKNFTGINDPYEAPRNPEVRVNTAELSVDQAVDLILEQISERL
jgi:adenylylsulfate kinase